MGTLKDQVRDLYKAQGLAMKANSATAVYEEMQRPNRFMRASEDVRMGMFAFILYDLAGKSSKMEQYSPVLLCDWRQVKTKRYIWGLSLNFIPATTRVVFFDALLERQQDLVNSNAGKDKLSQERPLGGITFDAMYSALQSIGYEYALRQFDYSLITKMYDVSFGFLDKFLTFDTSRFTGVGEDKLAEIWLSKIKEQEERHQKMMVTLFKDYDRMADILKAELLTATQAATSLSKTAANMRKLAR